MLDEYFNLPNLIGVVNNDPNQSVYDAESDKKLIAIGHKILRFENNLVFNDMPGVLTAIESNSSLNILS